jgi:hypothetical protein
VGSIIYEVPVGRGRALFSSAPGAVNAIIGGWQMETIITFSDGTPVNVGNTSDPANTTNPVNRPNATGISPNPKEPSISKFWEITAFDATSESLRYTYGNAGRNILKSPGYRQWDMSLMKNTRIREGQSLQLRIEAFNAANHPNWNTPSTSVLNPALFGKVTSAKTMREMQVGLKYIF